LAAAINYAILTIAKAGSNVVSVPQLYGGTYTLFAHMLPGLGVEVRFAADDQPASLEKLIDDRTAAVFLETMGNPAGNVADIEAITAMAHSHGVPVIADATVTPPVITKPKLAAVSIAPASKQTSFLMRIPNRNSRGA